MPHPLCCRPIAPRKAANSIGAIDSVSRAIHSAYKGHIPRRSRSRLSLTPLSFVSPPSFLLSFFSPVSVAVITGAKTWDSNKETQSACVRVLSFLALRIFYQHRRLDLVVPPLLLLLLLLLETFRHTPLRRSLSLFLIFFPTPLLSFICPSFSYFQEPATTSLIPWSQDR